MHMHAPQQQVIIQCELQELNKDRTHWTNVANVDVNKATLIGEKVGFENVCWGDGACLYYSLGDQIERPEIVNANRRHRSL